MTATEIKIGHVYRIKCSIGRVKVRVIATKVSRSGKLYWICADTATQRRWSVRSPRNFLTDVISPVPHPVFTMNNYEARRSPR